MSGVETDRDPPASKRRSGAGAELLKAATRPSPQAAAGMVAIACAVLVVGALAIDLPLLGRLPANYLLASEEDVDAYVTWRVSEIRQSPPERSAVAVMGASTILYALSDDATFERMLQERLGPEAVAYNLCAGGMKLPQYLAVAEYLDDRVGGAIVINLGVVQLMIGEEEWSESFESPRLGLPSPALDEEYRRLGFPVPTRTGLYAVDQFKFIGPRISAILRNLALGPRALERHLELPPQTEGQIRRGVRRLYRRSQGGIARYAENREANLEVVARLIDRIREQCGAEIVLLESTWNPVVFEMFDQDAHRERLVEFAAEHGVEYWDLNQEAGLRLADFADYGHVVDLDARRRFTRLFTERLGVLLMGNGTGVRRG